MKTISKIFIAAIITILVLVPLSSRIVVQASNNEPERPVTKMTSGVALNKIEYDTIQTEDDFYYITTQGNDMLVTTTIKNSDGTVTLTSNPETGKTFVSSDFMTEEEIQELQEEADSQERIRDLISETPSTTSMLRSQTGSWAWSSWQNKSITNNKKFTIQTAITALGAKFGMYGVAASSVANIIVQYGMKTGYFKVRAATRKDTDYNYVWTKNQVKLYKESSRKTLLSTKESTARKTHVLYG
ncbi:hypothetical protein X560_0365 [Listeria fleischmannii 1991]|uniref:Uncharacterized protein n=2 Tax=Listeria fleischmannii TaxID=1069827 RepID=A0A2X3H7V5_9LIST|nr:hypothetical protein [Listeria fleischmannii]EMG27091.1 hypothetical protein LFLEISCH_13090 [Listeria fleischmannii subsp. fleischmannii LU2006-1]KMT60945.1 hypothetical protein X560_0365 [Listeria fleischmannii 1991]SQC70616.1 Uncharacterised protein [Listeria fleischmannii subsp. fleischmannii]